MGRVFTNGPGDGDSIRRRVILKTQKWYLMPPYLKLSIISYGSRVSGTIQGKENHPSLHLGDVTIKMGAFRSPSTMVTNIYIYIYGTWQKKVGVPKFKKKQQQPLFDCHSTSINDESIIYVWWFICSRSGCSICTCENICYLKRDYKI